MSNVATTITQKIVQTLQKLEKMSEDIPWVLKITEAPRQCFAVVDQLLLLLENKGSVFSESETPSMRLQADYVTGSR